LKGVTKNFLKESTEILSLEEAFLGLAKINWRLKGLFSGESKPREETKGKTHVGLLEVTWFPKM